MNVTITPDKNLPQRYIEASFTNDEARAMEDRIPRETFDGMTSKQCLELGIFAILFGMWLQDQEKKAFVESKKIIAPTGGFFPGGN